MRLSGFEDREILTLSEVSKYLRVHPATIYRLLERKQICGFRVGGVWRFAAKDIIAWRERVEKASQPKTVEIIQPWSSWMVRPRKERERAPVKKGRGRPRKFR